MMVIQVETRINSTSEEVWRKVTDIENAGDHISGIEKVEILNKPDEGLVGLKWRETRILFGKKATEVMWITEAEDNKYYATRAESHGAVYITVLRLEKTEYGTLLLMSFRSEAQTAWAKLSEFIFGKMLKKTTKKALQQDLTDIKNSIET